MLETEILLNQQLLEKVSLCFRRGGLETMFWRQLAAANFSELYRIAYVWQCVRVSTELYKEAKGTFTQSLSHVGTSFYRLNSVILYYDI